MEHESVIGRRILASVSLALLIFVALSLFAEAIPETPAVPSASSPADSDASSSRFRFVILGDIHIDPGAGGVTAVHRLAIQKITREIHPAFVIQTGDLINIGEGNSKNSESAVGAMWDNARREVAEPLSNAGILFFHTPGNHDGTMMPAFTSDISRRFASEFYSAQAARNRNYQISGEYGRYYSFNYGNAHFVSLFAPGTYGLADASAQMAWLQSDFQSTTAPNIFTFAHSPIRAPELIAPASRSEEQYLQRSGDLMRLLQSKNVDMHFAGHIHVSKEEVIQGIRNLISGPLGGGRSTLAETRVSSPFAFTVVDVDGERIQYYKIEWPGFDTSALPEAPIVTSPIPSPEVPSSLAAIGVCPPGTRPAENVEGGIASMLPAPPLNDASASSILGAAHRYEGRPYGSDIPGGFVCTTFVEQVLRDVGVAVTDVMHRQIQIIPDGRTVEEWIASDAPILRGVAGAIAQAGIGDSVRVEDAQPGDFVQYWWRTSSTWHGHSVIIERAKGNGVFDVYGAHSTTVTTLQNENLGNPEKKVFIARLRQSSASGSPASSSASRASAAADAPVTSASDDTIEPALESSGDVAAPSAEDTSAKAPAVASASASPSASASAGTLSGCGSKIAVIGDSHTAGSSTYVARLRALCTGTEIKNEDGDPATLQSKPAGMSTEDWRSSPKDKYAFVGKSTAQMLSDLGGVLRAWPPDTLIVLGGTNDLTSNWETVRTRLLDMYNMAKAQGIRVVAVTIPPYKTAGNRNEAEVTNLKRLNTWIMTESPADIKVNTYTDLVRAGTDDVNPDYFGSSPTSYHMNPAGHQLVARKIHERLMGAAPQALPSAAASAGGASSAAPAGPQVTCVPESVLPTTLYDFLINSSMGMTTIVGIARQNIAIGINKTAAEIGAGAVCQPLTASSTYDINLLKERYGRNQLEVESQLQTMRFMESQGVIFSRDNEVRVHRLIAPVVRCVERAIKECPEGNSYDFRSVGSYVWQGIADSPDLLATSSFGISIDINLDTNPSAQNGQLITDIPRCVVDAFKRYGFRWGGDFETAKSPAHFEFMADPNRIAVATAGVVAETGAGRAAAEEAVSGDVVIGYVVEGKGASEFTARARVISRSTGGSMHELRNAQDLLDAIRGHEHISRLVLLGHGTLRGYMRPGAAGVRIGSDSLPTFVSVDTLARELAPKMTRNAVIGLAACSNGANSGEVPWSAQSYGPGGENGFAAKLRDALSRQQNIASGIEVRAHTTVGHTTTNPAVRKFLVGAEHIGEPGRSVVDETWGPNSYLTRYTEWANKFRGSPAEAWISGGDVRVA
jgi:hypothetical protein